MLSRLVSERNRLNLVCVCWMEEGPSTRLQFFFSQHLHKNSFLLFFVDGIEWRRTSRPLRCGAERRHHKVMQRPSTAWVFTLVELDVNSVIVHFSINWFGQIWSNVGTNLVSLRPLLSSLPFSLSSESELSLWWYIAGNPPLSWNETLMMRSHARWK